MAEVAVAVVVVTEDDTDLPKRESAKFLNRWFPYRSKCGHSKLPPELNHGILKTVFQCMLVP